MELIIFVAIILAGAVEHTAGEIIKAINELTKAVASAKHSIELSVEEAGLENGRELRRIDHSINNLSARDK